MTSGAWLRVRVRVGGASLEKPGLDWTGFGLGTVEPFPIEGKKPGMSCKNIYVAGLCCVVLCMYRCMAMAFRVQTRRNVSGSTPTIVWDLGVFFKVGYTVVLAHHSPRKTQLGSYLLSVCLSFITKPFSFAFASDSLFWGGRYIVTGPFFFYKTEDGGK